MAPSSNPQFPTHHWQEKVSDAKSVGTELNNRSCTYLDQAVALSAEQVAPASPAFLITDDQTLLVIGKTFSQIGCSDHRSSHWLPTSEHPLSSSGPDNYREINHSKDYAGFQRQCAS